MPSGKIVPLTDDQPGMSTGAAPRTRTPEGSAIRAELRRWQETRRIEELSEGLQEADALIMPLVLSLARLAAQRQAHG